MSNFEAYFKNKNINIVYDFLLNCFKVRYYKLKSNINLKKMMKAIRLIPSINYLKVLKILYNRQI